MANLFCSSLDFGNVVACLETSHSRLSNQSCRMQVSTYCLFANRCLGTVTGNCGFEMYLCGCKKLSNVTVATITIWTQDKTVVFWSPFKFPLHENNEKQWKIRKNMKQKIAIENRNGKRTELKSAYEKNQRFFAKNKRKRNKKNRAYLKIFSFQWNIYLADIFFTINYFLLTLYLSNPYNLPSIGFNRKGDEGDNNPTK